MKCIFTDIWALDFCSTRFFLTLLLCNGIAKITRQEENVLFILTTVYPLNPALKHFFFHYCTKPIDRNTKLGARVKRSLKGLF